MSKVLRTIDPQKVSPGVLALNPWLSGTSGQPMPEKAVAGPTEPVAATFKGKPRREMNDLEEEYSLILERQKLAGEILGWDYECMTLRWGTVDVLKYTPDFCVFRHERLLLIETKGKILQPEAIRRFKDARNYWTHFEFQMHQRIKGRWDRIF